MTSLRVGASIATVAAALLSLLAVVNATTAIGPGYQPTSIADNQPNSGCLNSCVTQFGTGTNDYCSPFNSDFPSSSCACQAGCACGVATTSCLDWCTLANRRLTGTEAKKHVYSVSYPSYAYSFGSVFITRVSDLIPTAALVASCMTGCTTRNTCVATHVAPPATCAGGKRAANNNFTSCTEITGDFIVDSTTTAVGGVLSQAGLTRIDGFLTITGDASVTGVQFDDLTYVGRGITIEGLTLSVLKFPALTSVGGYVKLQDVIGSYTFVNAFPVLTTVADSLMLAWNPANTQGPLTVWDNTIFPALTFAKTISIYSTTLTLYNRPSLIFENFRIVTDTSTAITSITWPTNVPNGRVGTINIICPQLQSISGLNNVYHAEYILLNLPVATTLNVLTSLTNVTDALSGQLTSLNIFANVRRAAAVRLIGTWTTVPAGWVDFKATREVRLQSSAYTLPDHVFNATTSLTGAGVTIGGAAVTRINAFHRLTHATAVAFVVMPSLATLNGFSALTSCTSITFNAVASTSAMRVGSEVFSQLTTLPGVLTMFSMPTLTSMPFLRQLTSIGRLSITATALPNLNDLFNVRSLSVNSGANTVHMTSGTSVVGLCGLIASGSAASLTIGTSSSVCCQDMVTMLGPYFTGVTGVDQCDPNCNSRASCNCSSIATAGLTSCQNGAVCADASATQYSCQCQPGWMGKSCEININECASNPCQNGGSCTDLVNGFTCTCAGGYTGTTCFSDINECASNPCKNGGTCSDFVNSFACACPPGFAGPACGTNINECASSPCLNSGVCIDGINSFTCACAAGYQGTVCATDIDECASNPCVNGATCHDGSNKFVCQCIAGWGGPQCQTDINECLSNPCIHGTCTDHLNSFTCSCFAGFTGIICQTDINECASNPCLNGATCVDLANSFFCSCERGFFGTICDQALSCPLVNSLPCNGHGECLNDQCSCDIGWCGHDTNIYYSCVGPLGAKADCAVADAELPLNQIELSLSGLTQVNNDTLNVIAAALGLANGTVYYSAGGNPRVGPYGTTVMIVQLGSTDAARALSDRITSGTGIDGLHILASRRINTVSVFNGDEVATDPILSPSAAVGLAFMGLCVILIALAFLWTKCYTPAHALRVKSGHGGATEIVDVVDEKP